MTSQNSFRRSTTRRRASRTPLSAHDLTRRFSFKPRLEHLEDRLAPAGGALGNLLVNGSAAPAAVAFGTLNTLTGTATGLSNPNTNNNDVIQIKDAVAGIVKNGIALVVPATTSTTGSFTRATRTINAGTYNLFAHDSTDATVTDSTPTVPWTVNKATTSTAITPSVAPINTAVTFTATVSDTSAGSSATVPNGTVTFTIDGVAQAPSTIAAGTATVVTTFTSLGAHTVAATYNGDSTPSNFLGSTAPTDNVTVAGDVPTTSVNYTATVTTAAAAGNGSTSITVNALPGALAAGTAIVFPAQGTFTGETVNVAALTPAGATTIGLTAGLLPGIPKGTVSSATPFLSGGQVYGQPNVLVTASVVAPGPNTPTAGKVLFTDTINSNVGSVKLAATAAAHAVSLSTTPLPGGITLGQHLRFKFGSPQVTVDAAVTGDVATTNGATAAHATSITVQPLAVAFASGTELTFGTVTVTLSAAAAAGATTISVNDIGPAGIATGTTSSAANVVVTNTASAPGSNVVNSVPVHEAAAPGKTLFFGTQAFTVENVVSSTSTPTGATNGFMQISNLTLHAGDQLKFGNNVVTLAPVPSGPAGFGEPAGSTYAAGTHGTGIAANNLVLFFSSPTTFAFSGGLTYAGAQPGDTTIYGTDLPAGLGAGVASDAANPGDTAVGVSDIGATAIPTGTTATTDNHNNPLFMPGAKTTFNVGLVAVNGSGQAVLNLSLTGSPPLVLPGNQTVYLNNGQPANVSPLPSFIAAQYVNGLLGGTSDPNFTPSPTPSATGADVISKVSTVSQIAVTPGPTAQFGQTVTMTAIVTSVGSLLAPMGTVTFVDNYTQGGITTNTNLGTVTLPLVNPGTFQVKATFTTASLVGGNPTPINHALRVVYNGDNTAPFPLPTSFPFRAEWGNSVSATFGEKISPDTTTATLSANPTNNSPFGTAVTFVDTLASGSGSTPHGGTVVFKDGTTAIGTGSVNIRGVATLIVSNLTVPANPHSITAFYNGSGNFAADTSNTLTYTIAPGVSTTTITGPASAASTKTLTSGSDVVTLTQTGGVATATFSAATTFTSNIMTISGATGTSANYNGVYDVTLGTNSFTFAVDPTLPATAAGTIAVNEFTPTPLVNGTSAVNIKVTVAGAPGFTPTGTVKIVAESNARDAIAASAPTFVPFTVGTATLAGGIATLALPATGAGSLGGLSTAAGNGSAADIYELEAFYNGDPNYTAGHSSAVGPHAGPQAAGDGEVAIRDTGVSFINFFANPSGNVVTAAATGHAVSLHGKVRPSFDLTLGGSGAASISSATGGFPGGTGHLKAFLDGVQFKTASGGNSTLAGNSTSGTFSINKTGITPGAHTIVIQYMGDGLDGALPPGSTTIVYTQPLVAASTALASPKGSVAFSTAPKSTSGTTTSSSSTTGTSGGLSNHSVDSFFASTSTTQQTPRTLAGALAKVHSNDDWTSGF
jgi:hypothetical protein